MKDTPKFIDLSLIIRGLMASAVVWWHTAGHSLDLPILQPFNTTGRFAVWVFFGLSGYVIGHGFFSGNYQINKVDISRYLWRRVTRIFPLFWIVTIAALLLGSMAGTPLSAPFWQFVALAWSHAGYTVGVFWTIGIELQFYLIAPGIALAMLLRHGLYIAVAMWTLLWVSQGNAEDGRTTLANLQFFMTGMIVALAYCQGSLARLLRSDFIFACGGLAVLMTVSSNMMWNTSDYWGYGNSLAAHIAIACTLIVHCYIERQQIVPGPKALYLMMVGVLAYGIYAWHGMILVVWPDMTDHFLLTYAASLALAAASHLGFEKKIASLRAPFLGNAGPERVR